MNRSRFAPLATSVVIFAAGLALGAGRAEDDTSIANTASKVMLTLGLLALVATLVVIAVSHLRSRRTAS